MQVQVQVKYRALLLLVEFIYIAFSCGFGFVRFFAVVCSVLVWFLVFGFCLFLFLSQSLSESLFSSILADSGSLKMPSVALLFYIKPRSEMSVNP